MRTLLQPFFNRTTLNLFPFYGTVNGNIFLSSTVCSSCNAETGQHEPLQGSCCPVSALQLHVLWLKLLSNRHV